QEAGDAYRVSMPTEKMWVVNRPSEIEKVLTASNTFIKDKDIRAASTLFGDSLLTSDGDFWLRQRRLAQPAFHRERIAAYAERMVERTLDAMAKWKDGEVTDLHREMMELTLHIASETLFGDGGVPTAEVGEALEAIL